MFGADISSHLLTYCVGLLVGMGINYKIENSSPLYKMVKEYKRERYMELVEAGEIGDTLPLELGYHISGGGDDVKVTMSPVWTI